MKKGKGELAREQKQRRALSGLLPYLSASDLLGTGLDFQKGAGDKYVPPSENKVIDVLFAFQHRQFVDKMTLRLLHVRSWCIYDENLIICNLTVS